MTAHADSPAELSDLRALVRRHGITWRVRPEQAVQEGVVMTVGYRIELSARHDHPQHPPWPGCPECTPVIDALRRVIDFVLAKGAHEAREEVHFGTATHTFVGVSEESRMTASVTILHSDPVGAPPTPCQEDCLKQIIDGLRAVGAREGT